MKLSIFSSKFCLFILFTAVLGTAVNAQVGNDNLTGISGQFNGNVTTGGSYDPYTGNVTRSITDLAVAGGVGAYPLAFTRTMNSRYTVGVGTPQFGEAGTWRHNYQWSIDPITFVSQTGNKWTWLPTTYAANYPDGRRLLFTTASPYFRATGGLGERFQQLTSTNNNCYLLLPDGGKVWFQAQIDRVEEDMGDGVPSRVTSTFSFTFCGITDPYNVTTTISYPPDGSMTITEPAGRMLKLFYVQITDPAKGIVGQVVIGHVEEWLTSTTLGRNVQYSYTAYPTPNGTKYTSLSSVFFNDIGRTAYYEYQNGNVDANGRPLIRKCVDPLFSGPMWRIAYIFRPNAAGVVAGQIQSENYLDPSGNIGAAVSTLAISGSTRTETRGDGPTRTFNYSSAKKTTWTDFKNVTASKSYDGNGYVNAMTDLRGNTTNVTAEPITGKVTLVTQPLTPFDGGVRPTVQTVYGYPSCPDVNNRDANNPYYVYSIKNERNYTTFYTRYADKRVQRIDYPIANTYETFTYNSFGQVQSHRMTSGGTETFEYDGRGLLTAYRDPYHPYPSVATWRYSYDVLDRLWQLTDALGTSTGDPLHTTTYIYNSVGMVKQVTHPDGTYVAKVFGSNGTVSSVRDELNHTTSYFYDDYKRLTSVTNPLSQTTTYNYAPDFVNSYVHTTSNLKATWSPMGKATHFLCDENWRRTIQRDAAGSADETWTYYGYDAAGNLAWVQDPKGNVRNSAYDQRNRRTSTTDPAPFNAQVMNWAYDGAGNVTKVTRPDTAFSTSTYDAMNRVTDSYGFGSEHTHYDRDTAGNVTQLTDAKNAIYGFSYDYLNRKTGATYPLDATSVARTESWRFNSVGNLDLYRNRAYQYKHLEYDNRNRLTRGFWNSSDSSSTPSSIGPEATSVYDAASRLTSVATKLYGTGTNETVVAFGYDDANRRIAEDQTLNGVTHHVATPRDSDGNRSALTEAGGYALNYDYTQRNQLWHIKDGGGGTWFTYVHDLNGNVTERRNNTAGVNDYTAIDYDELNRPKLWKDYDAGFALLTQSYFGYDSVSRLTGLSRLENANQGEAYTYHGTGQLLTARYGADFTSGSPVGGATTSYNLDALDRTGTNGVNANGVLTPYAPNALNQYTTTGSQSFSYDGNFNLAGYNGWSYASDAENRLYAAVNGSVYGQFTYDGLGRCVKRTINGVTRTFTYDGWKAILEWDGTGAALVAWNIYGPGADEILLRAVGSGTLRYHTDRLGNVAFILDASGNRLEKYTYDAFGKPTVVSWVGGAWDTAHPRSSSLYDNRFMFTGREFFAELGIMDYRNRFYHPDLGRFLEGDPTGFSAGDTNFFRYCGGDPVNLIDPSGLAPSWWKRFTEALSSFVGSVTTETVVVSAPSLDPSTFAAGGGDGWTTLSDVTGSFGTLNQGGGGSGWLGGISVSLTSGVHPTSIFAGLGTRTGGTSSLMPHSSGAIASVNGETGLIFGAAGNYSLGYGAFTPDSGGTNWGGWQSYGYLVGGPVLANTGVDEDAQGVGNGVFGSNVGIGGGAWFSNAQSRSDLLGTFRTLNLNTPNFSASLGFANGIYIFSLTTGTGLGPGSVTSMPTNTTPPPFGH